MNPHSDCTPMRNQRRAAYQAQRHADPVARSLEQSADTVQRAITCTNLGVQEHESGQRANNSGMKTHWTAEELHRAMGCHKFQNYKTLLQVSCNGEWIDGGNFPPCWVHLLPFQKPNAAFHLTKQNISIWMPFIRALHLVTVFLSAVLTMHLSLLIAQADIIGRLA